MVDLEVLKAYGIDAEGLRKKFEKPGGDISKLAPKVKKLVERMRSRIQADRDFNMSNYQHYYALDLAWDMPFKQITPTMITTLIDKNPNDKEVQDTMKSWGIDLASLVEETVDPKTPGTTIKKVNIPAFFQIYVPLVQAYVKVRWAKIINDRRLVPFFKYEPVISNSISRMRCETLTSRVEAMSRQYGYFDVMKQAVFRMLHYGECLQFTTEEWHTELQEHEEKSKFKGQPKSEKTIGKLKVKTVITKEGLRYHLPHPTRTYYDRSFFPSTFNTDTGCTYAGYWQVVKWKDLVSNKAFYNKEVVGYEDFAAWFGSAERTFWTNTLRGCAIDFPGTEVANAGTSKDDTEKHIAKWYSSDLMDKPVVVTHHKEKLIPSEWGLGDYDYPVWFSFVIAADSTVLYCAPLAYPPTTYYGYDAAEGRTRNVSMSLEVLPFQDQFSNLLTQYLLTVRQNLTNLTVLDTDFFDQKEMDAIKNWGERWWRKLNIFGKSFKNKAQKLGTDPRGVVQNYKFPYLPTTDMLQAMKTILDTLERVLVMSAQEVGQSASHEQTREEVKNIQNNTSTRVTFTATAVDIARDAWKRQIYQALMAYGSDEFYAEVPMDEEISKEDLEKLGFTYNPENDFDDRKRRATVKANKTAIAYLSFASDRDGDDRINDVETANAMTAFLDRLTNNPLTAQAIGPEQAIDIANAIARFAGFPRDFKLKNVGPNKTPEEQTNEIFQQVQQMIQEVVGQVTEEVKSGFEALNQENEQQDLAITELAQKLDGMSEMMATNLQPPDPRELDSVGPAPANALSILG